MKPAKGESGGVRRTEPGLGSPNTEVRESSENHGPKREGRMTSATEQRAAAMCEQRLAAALEQAEAELAAVRPSAEQLRAEAAEVERQAALHGVNAKTSAVVDSMRRRWAAFLEVHGEAYEYDPAIGPTVELAMQCVDMDFQ